MSRRHRLLCFRFVHVRNLDQKMGGNLSYEMGLGACFSERVFHAPPGARRFCWSNDAEVKREATRFV